MGNVINTNFPPSSPSLLLAQPAFAVRRRASLAQAELVRRPLQLEAARMSSLLTHHAAPLTSALTSSRLIVQNYTLMSTDNAHPTRLACKKLLESMGVSVAVQNADSLAILKCRVHELRGELSSAFS